MVPVDLPELERAAQVACEDVVRTLDALHLAAAERLPAGLVVLTFDRRLAEVDRSMGLAVEGA